MLLNALRTSGVPSRGSLLKLITLRCGSGAINPTDTPTSLQFEILRETKFLKLLDNN